MSPAPSTAKSLGLAACTAVVVGNMVGSGFYLSPAAVAPYGPLAIAMWVVMGAAAICMGLAFARLARYAPATGGPYAYTRMAYGDFPGFLIAWGYWISIWASLPVIALAFTGSVLAMWPELKTRPMALALTLGAMWLVVLVNLRGVKAAGLFMVAVTMSAVLLAAKLDARLLAALAWVGGYLTPLLLSTGEDKAVALFAYLALLDAGALVLDHRKPWKETMPLAMIGTLVLYLGWYATFFRPERFEVAAGGLVLFTALFALGAAALMLLSTSLHFDGWNVSPWRRLLPLAYVPPLRQWLSFRETPPYGIKNERLREWVAQAMNASHVSAAGADRLPAASLHQASRLIRHVRRNLHQIAAPAVVLHASEDDVSGARSVLELQRRLGTTPEVHWFHHSYHMLTLDNERGAVTQAARQFLLRQVPVAAPAERFSPLTATEDLPHEQHA